MAKMTIKDLPLENEKVIMRVDFNVPLKEDLTISDDTRIKAALESIQYIINQGASLVLMSHLGRPKGKRDPKLSLAPIAKRLEKLLNKPVQMAQDCIDEKVKEQANNLKKGEILLLENLRYHEAEEKPEKDPSFAKKLSELGSIYVNDAFGTAHRKHSSTYTITKYFPKKALMGFLLEKEVNFLGKSLQNPKKPFFAIIGGSKVSSKMGVLKSLSNKVDALFIGGGMCYTFLKALGKSVGNSICEEDQIENVHLIIEQCKKNKVELFLPKDSVIADRFENDAESKIVPFDQDIPDGWQGVDIGPITVSVWSNKLKLGKTIFWNGPLGVYEMEHFAKGTSEIAKCLANLSVITIIGGGDSLAEIHRLGLEKRYSHLSTGGGASLEYIELGSLPGIEALSDK